jgi:hypothetical protein
MVSIFRPGVGYVEILRSAQDDTLQGLLRAAPVCTHEEPVVGYACRQAFFELPGWRRSFAADSHNRKRFRYN